ncbi:MAG: PEP-utilizing enzyme, partial [Anaerolineae bacterium]
LGVIEPGTAQAIDVLWDDPRLAPTTGRMRLDTLRRMARVFVPIVGRFVLCLVRPDLERERFLRWGESVVVSFEARSTAATTLAARVTLLEDALDTTFRTLLPNFLPRMAAGMASLNLLRHLAASLPEGTHDALEMTRGLPHNVTTAMDLALWATARAIKADPSAAARFEGTDAATLAADYLAGRLPAAAQSAMADFLRRYGMRGIAEIDLGRPRWRENPTPIIQVLQSYLRIEDAEQAPDIVFEHGAASAEAAIDRLAEAMRRTRWGWLKARLVRWATRRMRALAGLRESPKFLAIRHMGIVRESLLDCGHELAATGVLAQPDDIFFLRLVELKALAAGETRDWRALVAERHQAYQREKLRRQVPRLLLSDGQAFYEGVSAPAETGTGTEPGRSAGTEPGRGDGFLVGSPVSPGVVEGIVRVVLDPHSTQLAPGEILVCPGTDPAWTPLFLVAGGLVMEVGGLMTHGAVVAREYGIPAVVGVHQATTRLKTGQRIRVDGSTGQIAILD